MLADEVRTGADVGTGDLPADRPPAEEPDRTARGFSDQVLKGCEFVQLTSRHRSTCALRAPPADGVVLSARVVHVPELFEPLQELEVVLHFTVHQSFDWNGLLLVRNSVATRPVSTIDDQNYSRSALHFLETRLVD